MSSLFTSVHSTISCCFPTPTIYINRRPFKVLRTLGEGGFSFVYLIKDSSTGRSYALKKIRCPPDEDGAVKEALKEAEMYRQFQHENIIKVFDTCVVQDKDNGKTVYIFLPYYSHGNLQDAIEDNVASESHFEEREMLNLFRQTCYAVRRLHTYELPTVPAVPEYPPAAANEMANSASQNEGETGDIVPYAHRDVKPGNILLSDDGLTPILMDFGSIVRARIKIQNRQQALTQQDLAAKYSTMPYRAPELFDVKTNVVLDEKVDIWSLGCTLYAMAYGKSPFETSITEQGGSIALAVLNAQFRYPDAEDDPYSPEFRELINSMLVVDPENRPDIHQVIAKTDALLEQMN